MAAAPTTKPQCVESLMADNKDILTTIRHIDQADAEDVILGNFKSFIEGYGFQKFLISQLVNPLSPKKNHSMQFAEWPEDILQNRFQEGDVLNDPIVIYGMRSRTPFTWEQAFDFARRYGGGMMEQARDFNMNEGFMFPMRRPGSIDGGISIAAEKMDLSEQDVSELQLVCMHAYYRLEELHLKKVGAEMIEADIQLPPRERDVLQYAAMGKTFWEMSVILGISEAAAKDAMVRARSRLNCVNTPHAISKAISLELILP